MEIYIVISIEGDKRMRTTIGEMLSRNKAKRNEIPMIILFLAPALALYFFLFINPSIQAFYVSLFDWNGFTSGMKYIGLQNFVELFHDSAFWETAVVNSLKIIMFGGVIIFSLAFLISGLLSTRIKGRKFMRALIFMPSVINPVAVAILWAFIYNHKWGLLNNILNVIGLAQWARPWMSPETLFGAILATLVWMNCGFYCVILLAALDKVPDSYLDASKIEGANEFQIFFRIKLPLIKDVLSTAVTLWVIEAVKEFALLFAWGGGVDIPPAGATNMAVKMYITAFGRRVTVYRMGYATAMGVIMFLTVGISVLLINRLFRSDTFEY